MEEAVLRPARRLVTTRTLTVILAALVALLLAAAIWLGALVLGERSAERERQQALNASRQFAVSLMSADYRTFERDLKQLQSLSTGQMHQLLTESTGAMKDELANRKVIAEAKVQEAGVVKSDGGSARVLVSLTVQPVDAAGKAAGAVSVKRMQLDLLRVDGRWLVSNQQFVA